MNYKIEEQHMIKLFQIIKRVLTSMQRHQIFIKEVKPLQPKHTYIFPWIHNK
jgi:hypothetical protein